MSVLVERDLYVGWKPRDEATRLEVARDSRGSC